MGSDWSAHNRANSIAAERYPFILDRLKEVRVLKVEGLAQELGVSVATVRRDLRLLEDQGLLNRVFGGAVPAIDIAYAPRSQQHPAEKRRIGERAAELVSPGETVALDTGTTVVAVASCLANVPRITVVTNSIDALLAIVGISRMTVVLTGGAFDPITRSMSGPLVESFYAEHRVDRLFIGVGSVGPLGLRDSDAAAFRAKQAALRAAHHVIVVVDSSKFGRAGLAPLAEWSSVQTLVTDDGAPPDVLEQIRSHGVDVIVVPRQGVDRIVARG